MKFQTRDRPKEDEKQEASIMTKRKTTGSDVRDLSRSHLTAAVMEGCLNTTSDSPWRKPLTRVPNQ